MSTTQPHQPISSLGGEPSSWPTRTHAYQPFAVQFEAGALIQRTFEIWSNDLKRLAGISVLPYLMMMVGAAAVAVTVAATSDLDGLGDMMSSGDHLVAILGAGAGVFSLCMLLYVAAQVGTYVAVEETVRGEPRRVGIISSLLAGLSAMPAVIGVYFVGGIIGTVLMAPMFAAVGLAAVTESWIAGVSAAGLFVPTMLALCIFSLRVVALAPVVAVIEEVGAITAMRRAIELTRGHSADLFVAALAMGAVLMGLNLLLGIVGIVPFLGIVVQLIAGVVMASLSSVWLFLVYAGLRDRSGS